MCLPSALVPGILGKKKSIIWVPICWKYYRIVSCGVLSSKAKYVLLLYLKSALLETDKTIHWCWISSKPGLCPAAPGSADGPCTAGKALWGGSLSWAACDAPGWELRGAEMPFAHNLMYRCAVIDEKCPGLGVLGLGAARAGAQPPVAAAQKVPLSLQNRANWIAHWNGKCSKNSWVWNRNLWLIFPTLETSYACSPRRSGMARLHRPCWFCRGFRWPDRAFRGWKSSPGSC